MSKPRVRSSRLTRYATLLMVVLGLLTIFVSTTLAVVIVALGVAMYLFERLLVARVQKSLDESE